MANVRFVGIAASVVLLAYSSWQLFGADGEVVYSAPGPAAILLMISLASLGTLLGRVPKSYGFTIAMGVIGAVDAARTLIMGTAPHGQVTGVAYLAASIAALVCGLMLRKAAKEEGATGIH